MTDTTPDLEIDQLIWSIVRTSSNPHDYLNFVRHARGRKAGHAEALMAASANWGTTDAPALFPQTLAALEVLAEEGNSQAMFHLGRAHRLGFGVPPNLVTGTEWYRRGAALGNTHCIINLGRHTALQDPAAGFALFEQAAALGNPAGHCYWAHLDKPAFEAHMLAAVQAADPWSLYCHGYYLCEKAQSDTERASHRHWIERAADLGEPAACQYLGVNSVYGRQGMAKDLDAACYWLRKGASLGCEECIYWLGRTRLDLGGDAALEGMVSLHHAAMLGVARAQTTLGGQMVWRSKTAQAQADGMLWLHAAAAQGHAYGCYLLAEALREGRGCEADPTGAAHWYQVGADKGDADCQAYLGLAYSRGDGVEKNLAKAHNLFSIASLQGGAWPTYLLGLSFENGSGTDKDPQAAIDCYTQAANAGESRAAYRLGRAYLRGSLIGTDKPAAVRWLRKSASLGNADAKATLGLMLRYGDGVEPNDTEALKWFKQAAEQDDACALREIGLLYAAGDAVEQDLEEATRYMGRAASQGDEEATKWLKAHCPQKPEWLNKLLNYQQAQGEGSGTLLASDDSGEGSGDGTGDGTGNGDPPPHGQNKPGGSADGAAS